MMKIFVKPRQNSGYANRRANAEEEEEDRIPVDICPIRGK